MEPLYRIIEVSSIEAWDGLSQEGSLLIDVRTVAEWSYVGLPDIGSKLIKLSIRLYPEMSVNLNFAKELERVCEDKNAKLFFICRSGVRSREAAFFACEMGYKNCFNIKDGFEGPLNDKGHRGEVRGWKAEKLPWKQD